MGMTFNNIGEVYDYLIAGGEGADLQNIFTTSNDTNWRKEIQKTGYQQNVDFNVSGGNDKLTYYTSANYFNQESIVKGSYFNRMAFTSKVGYQATDKLKLNTDIQISYSNLVH